MNRDKQEILRRVERMIERLQAPMPPEEVRNGWRKYAVGGMTSYYQQLRDDVLRGERFWAKVEYYTVARGLDGHGVLRGPLHDEAIAISALILGYPNLNPFPLLRDLFRGLRSRGRR